MTHNEILIKTLCFKYRMKYLCNKPAGALLTQTGIMTPNRILIYPASNYFNTKFSTATASYRPKNDSAC